ncbi:MAG: hypothetical protein AYK18_15385 [Theionarchaea archaeon DG-70]|nr:MAG: hypothetical protein AYK18_15385 [Theionarchaea archaeon DG-70]
MVFIVRSIQNGLIRKGNLEALQESGYRDLIYELSLVEGADIVFLEALNQLRRADIFLSESHTLFTGVIRSRGWHSG